MMVVHGNALIPRLVMILTIKKSKMSLVKYVFVFASGFLFSQVTIEKDVPSSDPANASVSIEFGNEVGGVKGIVLPWVTDISGLDAPVPGTLVFDTSTQRIKYAKSAVADGTVISDWVDLSDGAAVPSPSNLADSNAENATAKTLIGGSTTDTTTGILVLGDTDKAMVLPRVNSYKDIVNPSAGMMVYITSSHQLAVYNGKEWTFWKE